MLSYKPKTKNMATTKSGFEILSIVDIPKEKLSKGILKALEGRETFVDTDDSLSEKIYNGDVFEAILGEDAELDETIFNSFRLSPEDVKRLEELAEELGEFEMIRVISI